MHFFVVIYWLIFHHHLVAIFQILLLFLYNSVCSSLFFLIFGVCVRSDISTLSNNILNYWMKSTCVDIDISFIYYLLAKQCKVGKDLCLFRSDLMKQNKIVNLFDFPPTSVQAGAWTCKHFFHRLFIYYWFLSFIH